MKFPDPYTLNSQVHFSKSLIIETYKDYKSPQMPPIYIVSFPYIIFNTCDLNDLLRKT
jgi:hypothetical protein